MTNQQFIAWHEEQYTAYTFDFFVKLHFNFSLHKIIDGLTQPFFFNQFSVANYSNFLHG